MFRGFREFASDEDLLKLIQHHPNAESDAWATAKCIGRIKLTERKKYVAELKAMDLEEFMKTDIFARKTIQKLGESLR